MTKKRWIYLIAGLFGMLATLPGQTIGVSAFTDELIRALSLSRVNVSLAYLIGTITSAALLTPAGHAYDRFGSRVVGTVSAVALGLSIILLTRAPFIVSLFEGDSGGQVFGTIAFLSFGFFLIRFWGQGLLNLVSRTMILKWFDHSRGAANAAISIVIPLTFSYAPQLIDRSIGEYGWQGSWLILAAGCLVLAAPLVLIFFRDPPGREHTHVHDEESASDVQIDDGQPPVPALLMPVGRLLRRLGIRRTREPLRPDHSSTLSEAMQTAPFWIFTLITFVSSLLFTGFTFHIVGILSESGIGRAEAIAVLFPTAVVSVAIQPLCSVASDYMRLKYFVIVHGFAMALFLIALMTMSISRSISYPLVIVMKGVGMAMFGINHMVVWPRFYGLDYLGAIAGFNTACLVAGSALGPYAFGLFESVSGSFSAIGWLFVPLCILLGFAGFFANNPSRAELAGDTR